MSSRTRGVIATVQHVSGITAAPGSINRKQMAAYQGKLKTKGVIQSMSRKGNCLDNAMAESFFSTLKSECFYLERYGSINELKADIDEYIHYYNHERISLRLKGLSPVEYRTQALKAA